MQNCENLLLKFSHLITREMFGFQKVTFSIVKLLDALRVFRMCIYVQNVLISYPG